jgi:hypothetical protein
MNCYADLDVSVIDALPPGGTLVLTGLVGAARCRGIVQRVKCFKAFLHDRCFGTAVSAPSALSVARMRAST